MIAPLDPQLAQLVVTINENQNKLVKVNREISNCRVNISSQVSFQSNMNAYRISRTVAAITPHDLDQILTTFVKYFLSEEGFSRHQGTFQDIFEIQFTQGQFVAFAQRLAHFLALSKMAGQENFVCRFLNLMTTGRIKAVTGYYFPPATFDRDLLTRIKADALVFPLLSKYEVPKNVGRTIWNICMGEIDNFLEAFSIITETPITGMDAMYYCQTYLLAMSIVAQSTEQPWLIGVPFILNILRKLYEHYGKTTPSVLPPLIEFTDPNFYQSMAPITNRDEILRAISGTWNERVTPILVGEAGVGKTSLLIEVARRIHQGTFFGWSKGDYKAFGGSAAALASAGGMFAGNSHIERVFRKIGEKKDHTILLLDEVHTFDDAQKTILKTFFDNSPRSIRYAVFATTPQGAEAFFQNDDGSLTRRFKIIRIPDLTQEETRYVLHHQALSIAPTLCIDPQVIVRIVNRTNGKLSDSIKILCQVLRKVIKHNANFPTQQAYNDKVNRLNVVRQEYVHQMAQGESVQAVANQLVQLENEKCVLEKQLESEQLVLKNHAFLLAKRTQLTYKIFDISHRMLDLFKKFLVEKRERLDQLSPQTELSHFSDTHFQARIEGLIKEYIYYNLFLRDDITKKIQEHESAYGLISKISDNYVTEADLVLAQVQAQARPQAQPQAEQAQPMEMEH